jgi:hypothetical protein
MGRPPKEVEPERKRQARQDELDRILIEGKFGQGKRRFSLSNIMCTLARTSETAIGIVILVMNIERWLKAILFCLFSGASIRLTAFWLHYNADEAVGMR